MEPKNIIGNDLSLCRTAVSHSTARCILGLGVHLGLHGPPVLQGWCWVTLCFYCLPGDVKTLVLIETTFCSRLMKFCCSARLITQINFKYTGLQIEQWQERKRTRENHIERSYKNTYISVLFLVHLFIFNIGRPKRGRKIRNSICKLYSFPYSSFNAILLFSFFFFLL